MQELKTTTTPTTEWIALVGGATQQAAYKSHDRLAWLRARIRRELTEWLPERMTRGEYQAEIARRSAKVAGRIRKAVEGYGRYRGTCGKGRPARTSLAGVVQFLGVSGEVDSIWQAVRIFLQGLAKPIHTVEPAATIKVVETHRFTTEVVEVILVEALQRQLDGIAARWARRKVARL